MNQDIDKVVQTLQSEVQHISCKLSTENDDKIKSKMLKQINMINSVIGKLLEIKTNMQYYR
jgi:hypothetical protein